MTRGTTGTSSANTCAKAPKGVDRRPFAPAPPSCQQLSPQCAGGGPVGGSQASSEDVMNGEEVGLDDGSEGKVHGRCPALHGSDRKYGAQHFLFSDRRERPNKERSDGSPCSCSRFSNRIMHRDDTPTSLLHAAHPRVTLVSGTRGNTLPTEQPHAPRLTPSADSTSDVPWPSRYRTRPVFLTGRRSALDAHRPFAM